MRIFTSTILLSLALGACGHAQVSRTLATDNPPAGIKQVQTSAGLVLANAAGLSLYTFDRDTGTTSNCYQACAKAWPPVISTEAELSPPFGLTLRTDGQKQVTWQGHPLYTYFADKVEGDIRGEGLGGVWHLANP